MNIQFYRLLIKTRGWMWSFRVDEDKCVRCEVGEVTKKGVE